MDVRRSLFPATYPHFQQLLASCDFYAFDEEMTGINVPEITESITFSASECYESKRLAASRYAIIQVGLTLFTKKQPQPLDASSGPVEYVAHPFNFILFPSHTDDERRLVTPRDVVMSPSAVHFLRRHEMDFQDWVYHGVPFCDAAQERALREYFRERHGLHRAEARVEEEEKAARALMTDEEQRWVDEALAAAKDLLARAEEAWTGPGALASGAAAIIPGGAEVLLPAQRSRSVRDYLTAHLDSHLPQVTVSFRRQGASYGGTLQVRTVAEVERARERTRVFQNRELVDALGFRLIFSALVESQKPCVGHNCFADLLFLMASLDGPLPPSLGEWKQRVRQLFPTVFDTKYLSGRQDLFPPGRFPTTYLGGLFAQYGLRSPRVTVELPLGFLRYDDLTLMRTGSAQQPANHPAHEAGFDSLMTGTVLLNLLAEMGLDVASAPPSLTNKIALFRSLYAVDTANSADDEYTAAAGVIDVKHDARVKPSHLESCFLTQDITDVSLYPVSDVRTLAVLPHTVVVAPFRTDDARWHVGKLAAALNEKFMRTLHATSYVPPHLAAASAPTKPEGARFTPPSASVEPGVRGGGGGGSGGLRSTPQRLMRRWLGRGGVYRRR